jgi:hypothetical protein
VVPESPSITTNSTGISSAIALLQLGLREFSGRQDEAHHCTGGAMDLPAGTGRNISPIQDWPRAAILSASPKILVDDDIVLRAMGPRHDGRGLRLLRLRGRNSGRRGEQAKEQEAHLNSSDVIIECDNARYPKLNGGRQAAD